MNWQTVRLSVTLLSLALLFFLEHILPHYKERTGHFKHTLPNFGIAAVNGIINALIFAGLVVAVSEWSSQHSVGLLNMIRLSVAVEGFIAFVLFDAWMYVWHRANHRLSFLWRFHRMHHIDEQMDASTALRFHPGEIIISACLRLIVVPLIGMTILQLIIYETVMNAVIIFHHSNIALPERYDRWLRALIVTPNMHRVHHSELQFETDSNYSTVFSFWDRLLRSFRKRADTLTITLGIESMRPVQWNGFLYMLKVPFIKDVSKNTY